MTYLLKIKIAEAYITYKFKLKNLENAITDPMQEFLILYIFHKLVVKNGW